MRSAIAGLAIALGSQSASAYADTTVGDSASLVVTRPFDMTYPPKSRRLNQEGTVRVRVLVDRDGVPQDCGIVDSSGHPDLDRATCEKFLTTRYERPTNRSGENVQVRFMQTITWVLSPETQSPSE